MRETRTPLVMLLALVGVGPASATPVGSEGAASVAAAAAACPVVFGAPSDHARHRARREALVELLELEDGGRVLVQGGDWDQPTPITFAGVDLVDVDPDAQVATVALDLEGVCRGTYRVGPDLELGQSATVLAVLDDAIVLEHEGELRVLGAGPNPVDVDMVWRASWVIRARAGAGARPTGAPPPRPAR